MSQDFFESFAPSVPTSSTSFQRRGVAAVANTTISNTNNISNNTTNTTTMSNNNNNQQQQQNSNKQTPAPPPPPLPSTAPSSTGSSTKLGVSKVPTISIPNATKMNLKNNNNNNSSSSIIMPSQRSTGDYYPTSTPTISSKSKTVAASHTTTPTFYSYYNAPTTHTSNYYNQNMNTETTTTMTKAPQENPKNDDDWFTDESNNYYIKNNNYNHTNHPLEDGTSGGYYYSSQQQQQPILPSVIKSESMEILNGTMTMNSSNHHHNGHWNHNTGVGLGDMGGTNTNNIHNHPNNNMMMIQDEPPLLEELGINLQHIQTKSLAVILPMKYAKLHIDKQIMEDADLAGPCVYGLLLATELLLAGKISFGVIYGFGLFSSIATTFVLNLMSPSDSISIWTSVSILGYSLLPVNLLAAINVFYRIKFMGTLGVVLASLTIGWCTVSSTRLIEKGCDMRDQRWLVGYPNALLYSAFVMLTIF